MNFQPSSRRAVGLVAVALAAFAVRALAVAAVGSYRLEHVTYEHGEIATNLVEGRGFSVRWLGAYGPTSQQAPVYPAMLAISYWMLGCGTPASLLAMQLFQACLGAITAVCVVLLAWELLPQSQWGAWLAGWGAALYPTLIYAATQIQVACVATLLGVAVMWLGIRTGRTGSIGTAAGCGVAGGLLILTDPILSLLVMVAIAAIFVGLRRARETVSRAPIVRTFAQIRQWVSLPALSLGVCIGVVAPWIVRNYLVHGELVFVKATFGYAFWQGNHPRSFGTDKIPLAASDAEPRVPSEQSWGFRDLERSLWRTRMIDTLYIDDAVLANDRVAELGRLSEPQRSRELLRESLAYLRANPSHYLRLSVQRLRYFLFFDETNPKARVLAYRASQLGLFFASLWGLYVTRRWGRQFWPTYVAFALVTLFHTLTIVSARFHIPLDPFQIIWVAAACGMVAERWLVRWPQWSLLSRRPLAAG